VSEPPLRDIVWVGSSLRDYRDFPEVVKDEMGYALFRAQQGKEHRRAKALKGFGGRGVLELVAAHDGDAYRAVYTVRFETALYVLHAFQKKSKAAAATPKKEMELIKKRLRDAAAIEQARNARER